MPSLVLDTSWDNLDEAFAGLETQCEDIVRGLTVEVWYSILNRTPQYYGRMVVSYTYSLNFPVFVDRSHAVEPVTEQQRDETPIRSKGSTEAVNLASFYSAGRDLQFKLGDTVYIANGVDHGEGSYSQAIEDGQIRLRSVNRPGAPLRRTLDMIQSKYGLNISLARGRELRTRQITDF